MTIRVGHIIAGVTTGNSNLRYLPITADVSAVGNKIYSEAGRLQLTVQAGTGTTCYVHGRECAKLHGWFNGYLNV